MRLEFLSRSAGFFFLHSSGSSVLYWLASHLGGWKEHFVCSHLLSELLMLHTVTRCSDDGSFRQWLPHMVQLSFVKQFPSVNIAESECERF